MAINIPIISEFRDKGINQATRDIEKFSAKAKKSFDGMATAGRKLALGLVGVGVAGVAIGKKLIDAGEAASTSNARIEQIADSMGLFSEEMTGTTGGVEDVTKRLVKLAEATARNTGVDQNSIKAAQAKLLTFKELAQTADQMGGEFDRATQAAVDLAAAGFGTAETNAVQLGKALNDPIKGITALTRSGITFTETEKERIKTLVESNRMGEAQQLVLAAIETQVGGTAEATANSSDKMKVAFSQLQERVGLKLLPIFERLSTFFMDTMLPALERLYNAAIPLLTDAFNRAREIIEPLIVQLAERLQPIVAKITDWMKNNTNTVKVFFAVLAGAATILLIVALVAAVLSIINPVGLVVVAIAALVAGVFYLWTEFETFRNVVTTVFEVVKTVITIFVTFYKRMFDALRDIVTGYIKIIKGIFTGDLGKILDGFKDIFSGAIKFVINLFVGMPRAIFGAIGGALLNLGKDIVNKIVDGIKSVAGNIGSAVLGAIPGGGTIGKAAGFIGNVLPFADGGIVTAPTLGLVGEAGPEAIIPLNQLPGMMAGGGSQPINIYVTSADPQAVIAAIRTYNRTNGPAPITVAA